jgi:predicted kinase
MPSVLILKGLPGSGKTTYAKELQEKELGKWKRVNKDDLREMLDDGAWSKRNEKFVLDIRDDIIGQALSAGYSVIVDDTNFIPKHIDTISAIASLSGVPVQVKFIDTPIEECIMNDLTRTNPVGEEVIRNMHKRFLEQKQAEPKQGAPPFDPKLRSAVLVDIDGTVALHTLDERGHFEYEKVYQDRPNQPIIDLVKCFRQDYQIIFLSGREDCAYRDTQAWLEKYGIGPDPLFMRKTGDHRKDSIIKRELFDENVRNRYNILWVLEDRDQVVALWRSMGLTCLQVAYGNF